jgi:hypothetical protein
MAGVVAMRGAQQRRHSAAWVFVPLAIAFLIIASIAVYGIVSPYSFKKSPAPPGIHGSLVWGDGIFSNKAQLKAWLSQHGGSYSRWARTHPAAVTLVKPRPKHRATLAKAKKPVVKTPAVRTVAASAEVATTRHRGSGIWLVVALGLLLGALAAVPQSVLVRVGIPLGSREREIRVAAIGSGAALLLGVIAATLLS